jgi:hypothetical protein
MRPSKRSSCPSGHVTESADTKAARRLSAVLAPLRASFSSITRIARAKSLSGAAQRAEWMPGSPPSVSTVSPESSAKAGRLLARAAASDLIRAFSANVMPVSSGSGKPSSPAETASIR